MWYRVTGRRVIHHFHDLGTRTPTLRPWIWLATDLVHNSQFGFHLVRRKVPSVRRKRNFVLPVIVDVSRRARRDPAALASLQGKRNIFFVGQIAPHKGIDLLSRAFAKVAPSHPDATLHLVGGCSQAYRHELDELCRDPRLAGRVRFWGFRDDVLHLLNCAYLYVHPAPPSRVQESFGRGVVEAMALGIPSVCFASGALQEIVLSGQTGLICDENVSALAEALDRVLSDRKFRDACGAEARHRFEQLYAPSVLRHRWADFMSGSLPTSIAACPVHQ
jgi:glycosyltransferase involved in cell wall biosynthesis